jgi:YD repeat-containing protein
VKTGAQNFFYQETIMKKRPKMCFFQATSFLLSIVVGFVFLCDLWAETVNHFYDAKGRLLGTEYVGSTLISYTYDPAGNLLTKTVEDSTDADGVSNPGEMGPSRNNPAYDGDGNGTPDYLESGVASFQAATGGAYVTLAVPNGQTLEAVRAIGNPPPGDNPEGIVFPFGFFEFTIQGVGPGNCATGTLYLPRTANLTTYYKYGATPENLVAHWYEFLFNGQTGAEIFHDPARTRVVLHFCDGLRGDDDLLLNGRVTDLGGPGRIGQSSSFLYLPLILR